MTKSPVDKIDGEQGEVKIKDKTQNLSFSSAQLTGFPLIDSAVLCLELEREEERPFLKD
jgi:hypothetical protein